MGVVRWTRRVVVDHSPNVSRETPAICRVTPRCVMARGGPRQTRSRRVSRETSSTGSLRSVEQRGVPTEIEQFPHPSSCSWFVASETGSGLWNKLGSSARVFGTFGEQGNGTRLHPSRPGTRPGDCALTSLRSSLSDIESRRRSYPRGPAPSVGRVVARWSAFVHGVSGLGGRRRVLCARESGAIRNHQQTLLRDVSRKTRSSWAGVEGNPRKRLRLGRHPIRTVADPANRTKTACKRRPEPGRCSGSAQESKG